MRTAPAAHQSASRSPVPHLASIKHQNASTLVCLCFICKACGIIDDDQDWMRSGHVCAKCGIPSSGGRLALPITIHILVDLVQQAYHSRTALGPPDDSPQASGVGTVLFFCSLREALLNWFIGGHLNAQRIPEGLHRRLLLDNKLASQKFGPLFESVTGDKWAVGVAKASAAQSAHFTHVSELMKRAAEVRNDFMHDGRGWNADNALATECVNAMPDLVSLFCGLHNIYVHPILSMQSLQHSAGTGPETHR